MINPKELRIDNLVRTVVTHINFEVDIETLTDVLNGSIEPIPLTNEWLEKLGFIKDKLEERTYHKNGFEINLPVFFTWEFVHLKDIKYVHQLQNIYFALTRTEL